jgi:hypothetical protein
MLALAFYIIRYWEQEQAKQRKVHKNIEMKIVTQTAWDCKTVWDLKQIHTPRMMFPKNSDTQF